MDDLYSWGLSERLLFEEPVSILLEEDTLGLRTFLDDGVKLGTEVG
jgi:hypothetical protein